MDVNDHLYEDLGFFHKEGGIFKLIDKTITKSGSWLLKKWLQKPLLNVSSIQNRQEIVVFCEQYVQDEILVNNGTIIMLQDFLKSDEYDLKPSPFNIYIKSWFQKLFQKASSSHIVFHHEYILSVFQLLQSLKNSVHNLNADHNLEWSQWVVRLRQLLDEELVHKLLKTTEPIMIQKAQFLYEFRKYGRHLIEEAIALFSVWDAWLSLAKLKIEEQWVLPEIINDQRPFLKIEGLFFPTLKKPVPIDFKFTEEQSFLLLTGANMSGKSTFLRSIGILFILAQMGAPVPAKKVSLTPLHAIYSNLSVRDDIFKGESFFYAEVNSMKLMAQKVIHPQPHLFLMDELFKGTNIEDAQQATHLIVKALIRYPQHIYVLSTHIYELAKKYIEAKEVSTYYMETLVDAQADYSFTYQLKKGVSNDKIGALMLQKEGIFDILNKKS